MIRVLALLLALAGPAFGAVGDPALQLPDAAQEERARGIGRELRCLVCQNQSIEDSDADLARDLRRIVREQVSAGRSDAEVVGFVHRRYGDFVLLRPRFSAATALLWATPAVALLAGGLRRRAPRRRPAASAASVPGALTEAERARLARLEGGAGGDRAA
ncbi:MAG: Cytochrome c heme lyase subunit CcmL [uncultured Acetobacteraceae bacterium]|uniref:Cytochrome c-type biogenesis protein n=1 Tax=uncultured Acetobacteraceae bacterium TaxID=169975 RepID=A0A6J4H680_9PROT|nr:MAG: Cytochrome c heme lyase subunit CcmL [uncultured Acetobacteraceae bacterium]